MTILLSSRQKSRYKRIVHGSLFRQHGYSEWNVFMHVARPWQVVVACLAIALKFIVLVPIVSLCIAVAFYGMFTLDTLFQF